MHVGTFLMLAGVGIASASWVFLLLSIVFTVVSFVFATREEHSCLEKYGDSYHEYVNKTPRYLGVSKREKVINHGKQKGTSL